METFRWSSILWWFWFRSYRTYEEWKRGNQRLRALRELSSYRTYEEWKLVGHTHTTMDKMGSYRTYEEWKPSSCTSSVPIGNSSYRTYEEWKPIYLSYLTSWSFGSYRTYEEWKLPDNFVSTADNWVFLPYLWGMETVMFFCVFCCVFRFLPYLWGMETTFVSIHFTLSHPVLTVPMRNGN